MEKKTIGAFIAVLRKANGMTQRELAEKLNVSDKAVSRWERDDSLPDLTMIPVLADIFGVTADELLRGQRSSAEAATPYAEEKSRRQLQYLLDKARTDYKVCTLVSILLAVVGVIASAIGNLAFFRAVAGFWAGCVFFATAAVLQTIFTIRCFAHLTGEDFAGDTLQNCKNGIKTIAWWGFTAIAVLFAFTLPLALMESVNVKLPLVNWLHPLYRIPGTWNYSHYIQPALAVLAASGGIQLILLALRAIRTRDPRTRMRRRTTAIVILVMAMTMAGQWVLKELLEYNRHWIGQGTAYHDAESFQGTIELPLSRDGTPYEYEILFRDAWGNIQQVRYCDPGLDIYVTAGQTESSWNGQSLRYIHLNQTIDYVDPHHEGAIYTYTTQQLRQADQSILVIVLSLLVLYPLEIAAAVVIYRKKAKALAA